MDPLTRGSLFHKAQAEFFRAMQAAGALPVTPRSRARRGRRRSTRVLDRVAAEYAETARAGDRARLARRDRRAAARPRHLGAEAGRRRATWRAGVLRVQLRPDRRGARSAQPAGSGRRSTAGSCCAARSISSSTAPTLDVLRVTDHKTGKNRSKPDLIVGGGATLQPVLYSAGDRAGARQEGRRGPAVLLHDGRRLRRARDSRSTTTRAARGSRCSTIIDRAVEHGIPRRRRRPSAPAPGATSGRSAVRAKKSASAQSAATGSPISRR